MMQVQASSNSSSGISSGISSPDHASQMDAIYRYQRHIYDASRKFYLLGRDRLIRDLDATAGLSVLEVGCGTGRNLIAAARRWPQAQFHGFDISHAMLETAASNVARRKLDERIALTHGDATDFATRKLWGRESFDRVFLSYTLSMIPGWELALDEAARSLAHNGSLYIVDFGQQERLPAAFRDALFAWLRRFDVAPRGDMLPVLEDVATRHGLSLTFTPLYRGYAWSAVLRR